MTETPTLAEVFTKAADFRFTLGDSPIYATLSRAVAAQPALAAALDPLGEVRPGHPPTFFAAVQCALRTVPHPLAGWFPTLGGERTPDESMVEAFLDLIATHGGLLTELCARGSSRTNDPGIAAITRPALGLAAAQGRPLALMELGAAAGLALLPDFYRYDYRAPDATGAQVLSPGGHRPDAVGSPPLGRRSAAGAPPGNGPAAPDSSPVGTGSAATLTCELRGDTPDGLDVPLDVARRIALERDPVRHDDPDAVRWLLSGVHPERTAELARVTAGLAALESTTIDWRVGDFLDELPRALADVPADTLPVVYGSSVLCCLDRRAEFPGLLAAAGRDLVWITKEHPEHALSLVTDEPNPFTTEHTVVLTSVTYTAGRITEVVALAEVDPWGRWLDWRPTVMRPRSAG